MTVSSVGAFTPSIGPSFATKNWANTVLKSAKLSGEYSSIQEETTVQQTAASMLEKPEPIANKPNSKKVTTSAHKDGMFSPAVRAAKVLLGEEQLNKVRAKAISKHSEVISGFVDTYETAFGNTVLKQLFKLADKDKNGSISKDELEVALTSLGFDWLKEKQIQGIFARADADGNGTISLDEWIAEAPKTLRTNLVKLAKKNGGELGFLS
jgi:EF-hand domain pair